LPAADDVLATPLLSAATYFAKLVVTDQSPLPVGSHTMPSRGLQALSLATVSPALLVPAL
jgi:hypothetical protein